MKGIETYLKKSKGIEKGTDRKGRIKNPTFGKKMESVKVKDKRVVKKGVDQNEKEEELSDNMSAPLVIEESIGVGSGMPMRRGTTRFYKGGLVKKIKGYQEGGAIGYADSINTANAVKKVRNSPVDAKKNIPYAQIGGIAGSAVDSFVATGKKPSPGGSALGGALKGAGTGAAIGSVVPVIGTAAGALIGGAIGGVTGLLKGKRQKREYEENLKQERIDAARQSLYATEANYAAQTPTEIAEAENERLGRYTLGQRLERTFKDGGKIGNTKNVLSPENPNIYKTQSGDTITGAIIDEKTSIKTTVRDKEGNTREIIRPMTSDEKKARGLKEGGSVGLTPEKAKKILKDGTIRGKEITDKQKRYFGYVAGGGEQKKAEGGEIDGKGGPKSDSIKAKIKPGSFVVPAENAHIAKALRRKFLGGEKEAKLNQGGGVPVKVSDGEELFSPEEVMLLKENGVNLDVLAPNADDSNEFADGGTVESNESQLQDLRRKREVLIARKGLTDDTTKARSDKDLQELDKKISEATNELEQSKKELAKKERDRILNQISVAKFDIDSRLKGTESPEEARQLRSQLNAINELEKTAKSSSLGSSPAVFGGDQSKVSSAIALKANEDLLKRFSDIVDTPYRQDANIITPTPEPTSEAVSDAAINESNVAKVADAKSTSTANKVEKRIPETIERIPSIEAKTLPEDRNANLLGLSERMTAGQGTFKSGVDDEGIAPTDAMIAQGDITPEGEGKGGGTGWRSISGLTALGIGQAGIGLASALGKKRPIGTISPELSEEYQRAVTESQYGLSRPERSALEKSITAGRLNAVEAIKATTTSPAGQYALVQNILSEGNRARLNIEATNQALKRQKVAMRTGLAGTLDARRRQLFEDKLRAFEQNQAASGQLLQAGISNIVEGQRLQLAKKEAEARAAERQKPINYNIYN